MSAEGPAKPFRAGLDSPVPELVAKVYSESPANVRPRLIACLLGAVGPLAMAALAHGSFGMFLMRSSASALVVTVEEARKFSEGQILELARYVAQASPAAFLQLAEVLQDENPLISRSLAGGLLILALRAYARRRRRTDRGGADPDPA